MSGGISANAVLWYGRFLDAAFSAPVDGDLPYYDLASTSWKKATFSSGAIPTAAADGSAFVSNGTKVVTALPLGDLSGSYRTGPTVAKIRGNTTPAGVYPVGAVLIALAAGVLTAQGATIVGTAAARPVAAVTGRTYFATDTGVFSVDDGAAWHAFSALSTPYRGRSGLLPRITSGTTLAIAPGRCQSSDHLSDIVLAAAGTLDITLGGDGGFDSFTLSGPAQTHGTDTFEASFGAFQVPSRSGPGTITTVGTALTLAGASFTQPDSEDRLGPIGVGDLIGTTTKGWARVKSIDSATGATLEVALPGGDAGAGSAWTIYERPVVQPGVVATDRRELKSLSVGPSPSTLVVMGGALTSNAANVDLTLGCMADATARPYYVWVGVASGNTVKFLSCNRTTPNPGAGFGALSGARRITSVWVSAANALVNTAWSDASEQVVRVRYEVQIGTQSTNVASALAAGAGWTRVVSSACVPPTARRARGVMFLVGGLAADDLWIRESGMGDAATNRNFYGEKSVVGVNVVSGATPDIALDAAQAFDVYTDSGAATVSAYVLEYDEVVS